SNLSTLSAYRCSSSLSTSSLSLLLLISTSAEYAHLPSNDPLLKLSINVSTGFLAILAFATTLRVVSTKSVKLLISARIVIQSDTPPVHDIVTEPLSPLNSVDPAPVTVPDDVPS